MTKDDYEWLLSALKEKSCFECDIFEKCQEENRDYCEKEQTNESNS